MNKIREIRISKEFSQWRLARDALVHQSRISLLENDLTDATEEEKRKLAEVLGVTVEEIFGDGKGPSSEKKSK